MTTFCLFFSSCSVHTKGQGKMSHSCPLLIKQTNCHALPPTRLHSLNTVSQELIQLHCYHGNIKVHPPHKRINSTSNVVRTIHSKTLRSRHTQLRNVSTSNCVFISLAQCCLKRQTGFKEALGRNWHKAGYQGKRRDGILSSGRAEQSSRVVMC